MAVVDVDKPSTNARNFTAKDSNGSMDTGSTATALSAESSPVSDAYQGRKTAHAEELASRLIAFSQSAAVDAERREREPRRSPQESDGSVASASDVNNYSFPTLPIPILRKASGASIDLRKNPPPPPPRRRSSSSEDVQPLRKRSHSLDASKLDDHQSATDMNKSSSFHDRQRSIKSDFSNSSASIHKQSLNDFNNSSSHNLSSSRDFNRSAPDLMEPRKVRVTQFNDEPEEQIESSESLPSHCDKKGRCINHSNVKLYKRQLLGGFSLVQERCPLCDAADGLVLKGRPTIVIKRSTSAVRGRRDKSLERKASTDHNGSTSTDMKYTASMNSPTGRMKPKLSKKAMSENEASPRGQGVSAFLEDSSLSYIEREAPLFDRKVSSLVVPPPPRVRHKLSRNALSETDASRGTQGSTSFLDDNNIDPSMVGSPLSRSKPKLSKKAKSDTEASRGVQGGTAFLEGNRSRQLDRGAPPEYSRSSSNDRRTMSTRNSPVPFKPQLSRKAMSETDKDVRLQGGTTFLEADRSRNTDESASTENSSPLSTPDTQCMRPGLSRRLSEGPENDQAPPSMLEKGLEKLSILGRKGLPNSRMRVSDGSTTKSMSSRKSESSQNHSKRRAWDNTGRCKKHPAIILAKKRPFGNGWDMIRGSCPMCAEADSEISTSKMNHLLGIDAKSSAPTDFNTSFESLHSIDPVNTPMPNCKNPRHTKEPNRSRSRGRLDASNRSAAPRNFNSERFSINEVSSQVARVHKMPYSAPWGESGTYTGEVNEFGKPNGQGKMRTKTGNIVDGTWINGCHENYVDKQKKMMSGFGSNIAPWKQNINSPHYEPNPSSRPSSRPSSQMRSQNRNSPNMPHLGMLPHIAQPHPPPQYGSQMQQYDQQWQNYGYLQQQPPRSQPYHPSMMYGQMPPQHYR